MIETEELKKKDAILAAMLGDDNEEVLSVTRTEVRGAVDDIIGARPDKTKEEILNDIRYIMVQTITTSADPFIQIIAGDLLIARALLIADEYLTEKGY